MDPERDRIAAALDRWLAHGCRRACPAWGQAAAEAQATVSGSTRLVLALGGRNRMHVPQGAMVREILLRSGDAVVVDRLAWNRPLHVHPFSVLTIDLMTDCIRLYLRSQAKAGLEPSQVTQLFLHGGADPALRAAADVAEALARSADLTLLRQATWLAAACTRRQLDRPRLVADPAWQRLREWIEDHLHEPGLGRNAVARACAMHPGHVSRVMARTVGCGLAAWVTRRRTERASDLLAGSDLPVAEIGRRCGFSSAAYFNHSFRSTTGASPGRWRNARSLS
jgi:AraC-like DNA-binding protein